jgi:nucleoside-diphosphate-sugar epimerase
MIKDYILITGATGYLGKYLVNNLIGQKKKLIIFSSGVSGNNPEKLFNNENIKFCNLTNYSEIIEKYNPKLMINLQVNFSFSHDLFSMNEMMDANICMPIKLVEVCSRNGLKRLISPTTFYAFGEHSDYSYNPINFFSGTKQAFSDLALPLAKNNRFAFDEIVIYDTFGFNDKRKKIVSIIFDAIKSGEKLIMSPGNQILDLTFIDTLAAGISQFTDDDFTLRIGKKSLFFATSENRLTLKNLVKRCEVISNKKLNTEWGGLPYRPREIMNPIKPIKNMNICDQEDIDLNLKKLYTISLKK